jgi:ribonuclease HI
MINEWADGWARNGWRRKAGPVKNLDLVQALYERARARPELSLRWIKAHDGSRWNEYADALSVVYRRDDRR